MDSRSSRGSKPPRWLLVVTAGALSCGGAVDINAGDDQGSTTAYGGDDGGHKTSMFNYVFQAWFTEMWRFDLRTYVWHKVEYKSACPSKRALHGAVAIGDSMYVHH